MAPRQFTTADATVTGPVNGGNAQFTFAPYSTTLLYSVATVTGVLLFRNGILLDEQDDYTQGAGYFSVIPSLLTDAITAMVYRNGDAPSKLRLSQGGLTGSGPYSLRLSPMGPGWLSDSPFMLFQNGLLLTNGTDYTTIGPWLVMTEAVSGLDSFTALIDTGGAPCTTADGSIGGTIDGVNMTFTFPYPTVTQMVFWNGLLLTEGIDYILVNQSTGVTGPGGPATPNQDVPGDILPGFEALSPAQPGFMLLSPNAPQPGDTLTAQVFTSTPPVVTVVGGPVPSPGGPALPGFGAPDEIVPGFDAVASSFNGLVPFTSNPVPIQITNLDGTLTYPQAVESLLFRNGLMMTQPIDGVTGANIASFASYQIPQVSDTVTIEAWTPDITDSFQPALNLPQQFSTNDGTLAGVLNASNNVFVVQTPDLVTDLILAWNGLGMTQSVDYSWACLQNSSAGPWVTTVTMMAGQYPASGDVLTAQIFLS